MGTEPPSLQPAKKFPLTPEQAAEAEAMYRHFLELRRLGVRMVLVNLDGVMGVRTVGKRVAVAELMDYARLMATA